MLGGSRSEHCLPCDPRAPSRSLLVFAPPEATFYHSCPPCTGKNTTSLLPSSSSSCLTLPSSQKTYTPFNWIVAYSRNWSYLRCINYHCHTCLLPSSLTLTPPAPPCPIYTSFFTLRICVQSARCHWRNWEKYSPVLTVTYTIDVENKVNNTLLHLGTCFQKSLNISRKCKKSFYVKA